MMYYVLLIIILIIWLLCISLESFELFSPATLLLAGLIVSIILAIIGISTWNGIELKASGLLVVALGALSFAAGGILVTKLKRLTWANRNAEAAFASIRSPKGWKYCVLGMILIVAVVMRVVETYELADKLGIAGNNYFNISREVRNANAVFVSAESARLDVGFSIVERQFEKVVTAIGYVSVFLIAYEASRSNSVRCLVLPLILLAGSCIAVLMTGGRGTLLYFGIAGIAFYAILRLKNGANAKAQLKRLLFVGALGAVIVSVAFYFMGALLSGAEESGIVDYISFYFGCGVPSLQAAIDTGVPPVEYPGLRTFYNIYSVLFKFGLASVTSSYSIDWVTLGAHSSNVFTCFSRYFFDFGMLGVVTLSMLAGIVLTIIYKYARYSGGIYSVSTAAFLCPLIFDMAREEFLFSRLIVSNAVLLAMVLCILAFLLFEKTSKDIDKES